MKIPTKVIGEKRVCPVCRKSFKLKQEHDYIVKGDYTCSWKCFLKYVNNSQTVNK